MAETEDLALYRQTLNASSWGLEKGEDPFSFAHRSLIEDGADTEGKQNGTSIKTSDGREAVSLGKEEKEGKKEGKQIISDAVINPTVKLANDRKEERKVGIKTISNEARDVTISRVKEESERNWRETKNIYDKVKREQTNSVSVSLAKVEKKESQGEVRSIDEGVKRENAINFTINSVKDGRQKGTTETTTKLEEALDRRKDSSVISDELNPARKTNSAISLEFTKRKDASSPVNEHSAVDHNFVSEVNKPAFEETSDPVSTKATNRRKVKTPARRILLGGKACLLKRAREVVELRAASDSTTSHPQLQDPPPQCQQPPHLPHHLASLDLQAQELLKSSMQAQTQELLTSSMQAETQDLLKSSLQIQKQELLKSSIKAHLPYMLSRKSHLSNHPKTKLEKFFQKSPQHEQVTALLQTALGLQSSHLQQFLRSPQSPQSYKRLRKSNLPQPSHPLQPEPELVPQPRLTPKEQRPYDLPSQRLQPPELPASPELPQHLNRSGIPQRSKHPQPLKFPVSSLPENPQLPPPARLRLPPSHRQPLSPPLVQRQNKPLSPTPSREKTLSPPQPIQADLCPLDLSMGPRLSSNHLRHESSPTHSSIHSSSTHGHSISPPTSIRSSPSHSQSHTLSTNSSTNSTNLLLSSAHITSFPFLIQKNSHPSPVNAKFPSTFAQVDPVQAKSFSTTRSKSPYRLPPTPRHPYRTPLPTQRNCHSLSPPCPSASPAPSPPTRRKCHSISPPILSTVSFPSPSPRLSSSPLARIPTSHTRQSSPLAYELPTTHHKESSTLHHTSDSPTYSNNHIVPSIPRLSSSPLTSNIQRSSPLVPDPTNHPRQSQNSLTHSPAHISHSYIPHLPPSPLTPAPTNNTQRSSPLDSPSPQPSPRHPTPSTSANSYSPTRQEMEEEIKRKKKTCEVCGDVARSLHFGGQACDSCKAFFRRAVLSEAASSFLCTGGHRGGPCTITVATRRSCQACRFLGCVRAGMEVSLVTREDETLRHSSRHHHHHHAPPPSYNNPNSTPMLRYPWLSHLHSQLGMFEPVSITEASVPSSGAADFLSPADIGSSAGGQVSGSVDSCDPTASSNSYESGADPMDKLSMEDVAEVQQLKEAYFQAMEKVPGLPGDNDIKSEELGQAYKFFVERRAGFLVATPYYNTLAVPDRSRQLHIAVAMSTYFIGAHLMDVKDFTLRRKRAQSSVAVSPITLRQILSHHQYSHLMKFNTRFTSVFSDQTVIILMQVLSLFNQEPGAVSPEAVEAGRRHYGGLLARYVTASMGPTHAASQMASLLACQHEARKLVDIMDNLELTPTQPKPTARHPPPTTLLTNLQRVSQLMAQASKEHIDRNTPSTSSSDSTDNSATISVEEAVQLMGSLAQCNDPEVLARARAILPAPLLSRLLNLIRSSSPQLQQPDPSLEPQSNLQPEPCSVTQSSAQLGSQPHSNPLPQCGLFTQSRSQSQFSPQLTSSTQVEPRLQLQSNLESQSLQADDSRFPASVSPSRILVNTTPSLEFSPSQVTSRTSHSNRSWQSSSPSLHFSSIHSTPVRSAALHSSPPLQFVPPPPSQFSSSSSQFSVMHSSPSRHSPPFQLPVVHSSPSPSRHSPPFQLPVVHSSPSRYSPPSQLSIMRSSPPRLSFPSPNASPSPGQLRIIPLPPIQSHELAIKRPLHSIVTFTPPSSSNSPASSTPPTSLPDVSHPS